MKREYWAIYHPEKGYYLGKKPILGSYIYGHHYAFGWNLNPTLYKKSTSATLAFNAIPADERKGAMVISCFVDFPYERPVSEDDLFKEE